MLYGIWGVEVVGDCRCESDGVERGGERGKCCRVFDGFSSTVMLRERIRRAFVGVGVLVDLFILAVQWILIRVVLRAGVSLLASGSACEAG